MEENRPVFDRLLSPTTNTGLTSNNQITSSTKRLVPSIDVSSFSQTLQDDDQFLLNNSESANGKASAPSNDFDAANVTLDFASPRCRTSTMSIELNTPSSLQTTSSGGLSDSNPVFTNETFL